MRAGNFAHGMRVRVVAARPPLVTADDIGSEWEVMRVGMSLVLVVRRFRGGMLMRAMHPDVLRHSHSVTTWASIAWCLVHDRGVFSDMRIVFDGLPHVWTGVCWMIARDRALREDDTFIVEGGASCAN